MPINLRSIVTVIFCVILFDVFIDGHFVYSQEQSELKISVITERILQIKSEPPSTLSRTEHARNLSDLVRKMNPVEIGNADIDALANMMADRDDSVRYWIATSLGYIGPPAVRAVPELETALGEVPCGPGKTSAGAIRLALKRIGMKPSNHCVK